MSEVIRTLPISGYEFEVKKMSGHEEDLLTNEKMVRSGEAVERIMINCTVLLNGKKPTSKDIAALKAPDRKVLLGEIRKLSYGPLVRAEMACRCKKVGSCEIDLEALEYKPYDSSAETEVLVDGKRVKFEELDGNDEHKLLTSLS